MTSKYAAVGSVRGSCGHAHRSIAAAVRCMRADQAACASLPGGNSYSDREVVALDGSPISDDDYADAVDAVERG